MTISGHNANANSLQVLELMKEVTEEEEENTSSDISGYHSDSDSTVMMSGNSPFVSKTARYNFLSRSGKTAISYLQEKISSFIFQSAWGQSIATG